LLVGFLHLASSWPCDCRPCAEAKRTVLAIIPAARSLQASGALHGLRACTGAVVWQTMLRFHEIAATVKPHHIIRRRARRRLALRRSQRRSQLHQQIDLTAVAGTEEVRLGSKPLRGESFPQTLKGSVDGVRGQLTGSGLSNGIK